MVTSYTLQSLRSALIATLPLCVCVCVCVLQGKLSVFSIDEVKETLECALQEERTCLLNDIEYLTALLTDETDMQV